MSDVYNTKKIDQQAKLEVIRDFDLKTRPQELTPMEFTQVRSNRQNKVTSHSLDEFAKDRESFTGPEEGFFAKFGSTEVDN